MAKETEKISRIPERVRLYLDGYTNSVLLSDIYDFFPEKKVENGGSIGALVNEVFKNFHEKAQITTRKRVDEKVDAFFGELKKCRDEIEKKRGKEYKDTARQLEIILKSHEGRDISILKRTYMEICEYEAINLQKPPEIKKAEKSLREKCVVAPPGKLIDEYGIRDGGKTFDELCVGGEYKKMKFGDYLSELMSEYARLPYSEREKIYFKEKYEKLKRYIKEQIAFTYEDENRKTVLLPCKMVTGKTAPYTYVIFKEWKNENRTDFKFVAKRFSKIKEIGEERSGYGLTEEDKNQIKQALKNKDVMFWDHNIADGGKNKKIKIRLTPKGIRLYKSRTHMRPMIYKDSQNRNCCENCEDGSKIYTFECSESQAEFYFFRFGADAEVLEPEKLRNKFKKHYEKANSLYNT